MKATRPIGCDLCAKPCALVGDEMPKDGLCLWCRVKDAPAVARLFLEEMHGKDATDA